MLGQRSDRPEETCLQRDYDGLAKAWLPPGKGTARCPPAGFVTTPGAALTRQGAAFIVARQLKGRFVKRGLYRYDDPDGEPFVCVDWAAGDGAPFLSRQIYELLNFAPRFDALPAFEEFADRNRWAPVPLFLRAGERGRKPVISA